MALVYPPGSYWCGVPGCTLCAAQGPSYSSYWPGSPGPVQYAAGGVVQVASPGWPGPSGGMIPPGTITATQAASLYTSGTRVPNRGMDGFSGQGTADFEPAAGVVAGIRWWSLPAPGLTRDPLSAESHWPRQLLRGTYAEWAPGLNEASCLQEFGHPVPCETCADGFWAFWQEQPYPMSGGIPVLGVIEGSGRTLIGEKGFRCQRARITALHVPPAGLRPWYDESGSLYSPRLPSRDFQEAWLAVISDRLEQMYPDAKIYERQDTMLKVHPPDAPPSLPCRWCSARMPAEEHARHQPRCPRRLP